MRRNRSNFFRLVIITTIVGGSLLINAKLHATQAASQWFATASPEFAISNPAVSDVGYPTTYAQHGNIDCTNLTFTKRDGDLLPFLPLHKESQQSGCFISTSVGAIDTNGFIGVSGTNYVAETVNPDMTPTGFFAFPNSDVFVSGASGTAAIGTYVWFDHLTSSLRYSKDNFGRIRAVIAPQRQILLSDKTGIKLPVMSDNFGVSANGQWAVVDSPGRAILRINLDTLDVLPFASSFELGNGIGAQIKTAISSDGRYAVVASKNYAYFRIFDLATCATTPNTITQPVVCQSRDLDTFSRSKIADLGSILQIHFMTNNLLKIYASYDISNAYKIGQFALAAPGTSLEGMDYLALGDSFSSGEGSFKYEPGTDIHDINMCHLSTVSYPYIIAKKLQFNGFHSVACSGAKTTNISGGSGLDKLLKMPERDNQYNPDNIPKINPLGSWLPGYDKQTRFVAENAPNLITVSVVGNDINFTDLIITCVMPGTCFPTYEDRLEIFNFVDSKLPVLVSMFQKLKTTSPASGRIYAVGYPQIALSTGSCGVNVHMNESELTFAGMLISRIDEVMKTAAAQAGINYSDIENAFDGYRLCEGTNGNIAENGLTAGNDIHRIIGNESYHPTEVGQSLMAQKLLDDTNNFRMTNSVPSPTQLAPIIGSEPALASTPKSGRPLNKRLPFSPDTEVVTIGQSVTASLSGLDYALPPYTTMIVKIDDVQNTAINTDALGNITLSLPIDKSTQPGIHTVSIYGTDITGQPISIVGVIAVTDQTTTGTCGIIPGANQDIDKDGIDDACDPFIGSPPPTIFSSASSTTPPTNSVTTASQIITHNTPLSAQNTVETPPYTYSTTYTAPNDNQGQVLADETDQPIRVDPVKKLAIASRDSLTIVATAHPLRFIVILLTALFALIFLTVKYRHSITCSRFYVALTKHRIHIYS